MEIERKFLLDAVPFNLTEYKYIDIEQAYISTSPVIRIRKKNIYNSGASTPSKEEYILTVKSKGLMSREEFELMLEQSEYTSLLTKAEGNIISKKRYIIPLIDTHPSFSPELTLELDIFSGAFQGLIIGEIEFSSEEAAQKYNPPEFLSREVTFDNRFHNSSLSTMSKDNISELMSSI